MPCLVVHFHLDHDISGEQLVFFFDFLVAFDLQNLFDRNPDRDDLVTETAVRDDLLDADHYLVFIAGIRMHHIPTQSLADFVEIAHLTLFTTFPSEGSVADNKVRQASDAL